MKNLAQIVTLVCMTVASSAVAKPDIGFEAKLSDAICLVEAPTNESDRYKPNRTCLPGGEVYAAQVLEAYRSFPLFVQQELCSVKFLYIEKQFFGAAWSSPVEESNPNEMMIGLNQRELDSRLTLDPFLTWFEQLSFGGKTDFSTSQGLPSISIRPKGWASSTYLIDTLLHETGHLVDFRSHFNRSDCKRPDDCQPSAGSWTEIGWKNESTPKPENDFPDRKFICINSCGSTHLDPKEAPKFYRSLYRGGFVSQLSALNSMEDFAESFSLYVKEKYLGFHTELDDGQGHHYTSTSTFDSKEFEAKRNYLEKRF